ncbi:hypothetical protein Pelo_9669 [Pelomyxa schiedti]|nr:hypothetical protein Pelo_9669 [Pelomyxa schiedti]
MKKMLRGASRATARDDEEGQPSPLTARRPKSAGPRRTLFFRSSASATSSTCFSATMRVLARVWNLGVTYIYALFFGISFVVSFVVVVLVVTLPLWRWWLCGYLPELCTPRIGEADDSPEPAAPPANVAIFSCSDLHVGASFVAPKSLPSTTALDSVPMTTSSPTIMHSFGGKQLSKLESLFDIVHLSKAKYRILVINGDFIDVWAQPHYVTPKSVEEVMDSFIGRTIKQGLTRLANEGVHLVYVIGNHDDNSVTQERINVLFQLNVTLISSEDEYWYNVPSSVSPFFQIRIGHGHLIDHYNSLPKSKRSHHQFPIGYYVTRLCSSWDWYKGASTSEMWKIADNFLQFDIPNLLLSIYNTICTHIGESPITINQLDSRFFKMPDGTNKSFKEVAEEFQWMQAEHSQSSIVKCLLYYFVWSSDKLRLCLGAGGASFSIEQYARDILHGSDTRILVLGHTHSPELMSLAHYGHEKRVYINDGAISDSVSSFAEIYIENSQIPKTPQTLAKAIVQTITANSRATFTPTANITWFSLEADGSSTPVKAAQLLF